MSSVGWFRGIYIAFSDTLQGSYGRGGGVTLLKKAKAMTPSVPITSDIQKGDPTSKTGSRNSREGVSLFKQLSLSMSRKPSKKSTREAPNSMLYPAPPGAFPGTMSLEASHGSFTNEMTPSPVSPSPASQFVLDIIRSGPMLNVEPFTPDSSDEERSFKQHIRNVSSRKVIPSDSTTNTEATAINEVPSAFPKFNTYPFKEPNPPVSFQFQRPMRSRSLVERARPLGHHFERTRPSNRVDSTTFGAAERLNRVSPNNEPYTRGRRVTTGTPSSSKAADPSPPEGNMGSNSRNQAHREEAQAPEQRVPMDDAYTNLFTSCAISIFLLIILAAGKQVLYLLALLPVLSALVKHVPELDSLRTGIPLVKKNIQALLTLWPIIGLSLIWWTMHSPKVFILAYVKWYSQLMFNISGVLPTAGKSGGVSLISFK
jgi:hypothetical protein